MSLVLALVLDALFGEPKVLWDRIPHPVVLIGRCIAGLETRLNRGRHRRARGFVATLLLVCGGAGLGFAIASLPYVGFCLEALIGATLIAQRSLVDHIEAVIAGLNRSLDEGRRQVSKIVGRDPETLDEAGVARASIESCAENFSDGVVAPVFWFMAAGLPGIIVYKIVNTADSMIGHRTAEHEQFGWAAARLDDLLNLAPARLSGVVICLVARSRHAFRVMLRDARLHNSPNAGWPEAALAGALGVAIAGPRIYCGVLTQSPFMNAEGRLEAGTDDIEAAIGIIWRAWGWVVTLAVVVVVAKVIWRP